MINFDLHYHANINCFRFSKINRNLRLRKHRKHLINTCLDYVASTEHVYKNPLEAYLYLRDATSDLHVTIIPGVEWVSREGIELIFIFESETALMSGLKYLKPFQTGIFDSRRIKQDTNAVTIIPHPFSPGQTGIASTMGAKAFVRLLRDVDYVEIHNGLSLNFMNCESLLKTRFMTDKRMRQIHYTYDLPRRFRPENVGWAIGSDAHFPIHQHIVGSVDLPATTDWFELLKRRIRFSPILVSPMPRSKLNNYYRLIKNGKCACFESVSKKNLYFKNLYFA